MFVQLLLFDLGMIWAERGKLIAEGLLMLQTVVQVLAKTCLCRLNLHLGHALIYLLDGLCMPYTYQICQILYEPYHPHRSAYNINLNEYGPCGPIMVLYMENGSGILRNSLEYT